LRQKGGSRAEGLYDPSFEHDACGFGFVVDIAGRPSHDIVRDALTVLVNLEHRGATGSEKNTGDGAGLTIQIPHRFLADVAAKSGVNLRGKGGYGVGMVFLPQDKVSRVECFRLFEQVVADEGLHFLGWRDVPTENAEPGRQRQSRTAAHPPGLHRSAGEPGRGHGLRAQAVHRPSPDREGRFALGDPVARRLLHPSLSCRTIVYKGMLNASQLRVFYPDLADERVESAIAMVHSRFSTNTFPSWPRAHPYRYISHNGEINTLRGNVNWMHARQSQFSSKLFGDELTKALPAIDTKAPTRPSWTTSWSCYTCPAAPWPTP
jgi:glutamate synthase domain-containing protein 1